MMYNKQYLKQNPTGPNIYPFHIGFRSTGIYICINSFVTVNMSTATNKLTVSNF